jgi:hypothetical protein
LGFHPVAVVGKPVQKIGKTQLYTKEETIHKTILKHRIHKIEKTYKTRKQTKTIFLKICLLLGGGMRPNAGHGLLILEVSRSHTTHHGR